MREIGGGMGRSVTSSATSVPSTAHFALYLEMSMSG